MMERRAFVGRVFAGLALTAQWAKPALQPATFRRLQPQADFQS